MAKISIVTVCFNAIDEIKGTFDSVLVQDYEDYEHIIIDGASTDGTLDLIDNYIKDNPRARYLSEPDKGLYDAMNKGIREASGDVIQFLNAGDALLAKDTLKKVAAFIDSKCGDLKKYVAYGNIIYVNADGTEDRRLYGKSCGKVLYYATGDCVNHQACFTARSCFNSDNNELSILFDNDKYKICADRDLMMRITKAGTKWLCMDETVVKYALNENSVSVKNKELSKKEEKLCLKSNYPYLYPIYLIFDGCRNNKVLAMILHKIYEILFIR